MTKDSLYKLIQSFFSSGTVVIIGSGLSCGEGLPGMKDLSQELLRKVPDLIDDSDSIWLNIAGELSKNKGLEETLLDIQPSEKIERAIKEVTTNYIERYEFSEISKVMRGEKTLKITGLIRNLPKDNLGLNMITTNYDRLIEVGCNVAGIGVDTMFVGNTFSILNEKESKMSFCREIQRTGHNVKLNYANRINLFKPHGCLSWRMVDGAPISTNLPIDSERLVITPGLNKFRTGYNQPFDIHREKANNAIDKASKFIMIGYGFGDEHLETHLLRQISSGKPTLIITKELSQKAKDLLNKYRNIYAISKEEKGGTKLSSLKDNEVYKDIEIWDIGELCKEVF